MRKNLINVLYIVLSLLSIGVFVFYTFSSFNYYKEVRYSYSAQSDKYLDREKAQEILSIRPQGIDVDLALEALADRGYTIEGYNDGSKGSINYDTLKKYNASYFQSFDFILSIIILLVEITIFTLLRIFFLNYSWKKNQEKVTLKSSILDRILKVLFAILGLCIMFLSLVIVVELTESFISLFSVIYCILSLTVGFLIMVLIRYLYFYIGFGKHKYIFNEIEKDRKQHV